MKRFSCESELGGWFEISYEKADITSPIVLTAYELPGASFLGWYDNETNEIIGYDKEIELRYERITSATVNSYTAKFSWLTDDELKVYRLLARKGADGVVLGEKLYGKSFYNGPSSWLCATWDSERRLVSLPLPNTGLFGAVDLAGCTALAALDLGSNRISSLTLQGCAALKSLALDGNLITELVLTDCTKLSSISLLDNPLTRVECCLKDCGYELLTVSAGKNGRIGLKLAEGQLALYANAHRNAEFIAWMKGDLLLSTNEALTLAPADCGELRADYKELYVLGDADCDGFVTAADAALILRALVSLDELSEPGELASDLDNDDRVGAADAAFILRMLVGLEDGPVL